MLTNANDVINLGLIGCGAISSKHVEAISRIPWVRLIAAADKDEVRSRAVAEKTGAVAYSDYREMLDSPKLDAVVIATPSGLHAKMALDALDAGKHVLVEKPMAMCLEDADRMIAKAEERGKVLAVVHHKRFNRSSQILKEAIDSGKMGKLIWGSASVKWYRPQRYYAESGWRGTASMDGGVLLNQAIHHIDLLLWFMGEVENFRAFRATLGHQMECEDTAVVSLRFKNGALGSIDATTCAFPKNLEETVTVIGEHGSVIMGGNYLDTFRAWRLDGMHVENDLEERPKWYGHYLTIKDFGEAIRFNRKPAVDGTEGRKALELITKIYECSPIFTR